MDIGYTAITQGYEKMPHSTNETFFLFCECGYGIVIINFEKYIVRPGSFISVYSDDYFDRSFVGICQNTDYQLG